jgi:hypothetical protein
MRNPGGYAVLTGPDGIREWDSFTCSHCQRIVQVAARCDPSDLGGFCRMCMKHICGPCTDEGSCTPFEKKLEQYERANRFHQAVGTVLRALLFAVLLTGSAGAAELNITWDDNSSDEDSFELSRSATPDGAFTVLATTAANVTSYRDTLLTANEQYCYKIRACLSSTCSDYAGPICQRARELPGSDEFR